MAKQLQITVRAIDQVTGPARAMSGALVGLGEATTKGVERARGMLARLVGGLTSWKTLVTGALGALTVRGLVGEFNEAATAMDDLAKKARRLDVPVETLSSLKYAADLANVSFETLAGSMQAAAKNIGEFANTGGGRAAAALRMLGVNLKDAQGRIRGMSELLPEFANALNAIPDAQRRIALASRVFGNPEILNLLAEGGDRLRAVNEEARRLGAVYSPQQTAAAEEYRDAITRVGAAYDGMRAKLVALLGPGGTTLLNQFAKLLAALPEMVGNLAGKIRDAFRGDARAAQLLAYLGDDILNFFEVLAFNSGRMFIAGLQKILSVAPVVIGPVLKSIGFNLLRTIDESLLEFARGIGAKTWANNLVKEIRGLEEKTKPSLESTEEFIQRVNDAWSHTPLSMFNLMGHSMEEVAIAAKRLGASADDVLGFTAALMKVGDVGLPERMEALKRAFPQPGFLDGVTAALEQFRDTQKTAFQDGLELTARLIDQGIDGMASALVDAVAGVKSLGQAFREFGVSTLRMLSELAMKMALVRLLRAALGVFGGGGVSFGAEGTLPATIGGPALANRGGVIGRRGAAGGAVLAFAGGGMVPGPDIDRDIVPALLTPGEAVISRRGVAGNDRATLAYLNRGGRVEPAGGGVTLVVAPVVHVTVGGGGDGKGAGERIGRAVVEAVVREITTNYGQRDRLRKALA